MRRIMAMAATLLLLGRPVPAADGQGGAGEIRFERRDDRVVVRVGEELFTEYRFKERRPCLFPVMGPAGRPLTRRWPLAPDAAHPESTDHPHHTGIWFAHGDVRLEGDAGKADFWHNERIVHQGFVEYDRHSAEGALVSDNHWIRKDGKVIATDRTRIQFGHAEGARWIDYLVSLSAPGEHALILGDSKEGTMAMRVVEELTMQTDDRKLRHLSTGKIATSEGITDGAAWGTRAKWCVYHGTLDERPALVAIFDHPSNPRFPTWWVARPYGVFGANGFGKSYFEKAPKGSGDFRIPPGETVTFRYRFYFGEAAFNAADIEKQYMRFVE